MQRSVPSINTNLVNIYLTPTQQLDKRQVTVAFQTCPQLTKIPGAKTNIVHFLLLESAKVENGQESCRSRTSAYYLSEYFQLGKGNFRH